MCTLCNILLERGSNFESKLMMKNLLLVLATVVLLLSCGSQSMPDGSLRLVDGPSEIEGRIEVYYDGEWGTMCDDSFHYRDGNVICRQLGYEAAAALFYRARFGQGEGPIWIDQIACDDSDDSILDCRHNGWGINDCSHREDAGVRCRRKVPVKPSSMPIRLTCPKCNPEGSCKSMPSKKHPSQGDCLPQIAVEGIVEAYYNKSWHAVSDEGFDDDAARVVCGELGYPYAVGSPSIPELWKNWNDTISDLVGESTSICNIVDAFEDSNMRLGLTLTWLKRLSCTGSESRLLDCYFSEFGPNTVVDVTPPKAATVRCGFYPHHSCYKDDVERYRTRGSAINSKGRIEMYYAGEWGTVCGNQWDLADASVACRSMGYGTATTAPTQSYYGRGAGKIHITDVKCTGSEHYLSSCEHHTVQYPYYCSHSTDASVICNHPSESEVVPNSNLLDIPLPDNPRHIQPFVEVKGSAGWGLYCFVRAGLTLSAARVMCRSDREMFEYRIRSGDYTDYTGPRYFGSIKCNGDEESVNECDMALSPAARCPFGETIVDCSATLPDLVADLNYFQRSLQYYPYIDRLPLYYITCALEEECLSSSAYAVARPEYSGSLRHLLRFDSRTMNYGTVDFRPTSDISEWEWHDCHQHYHSYEAFIHYDLLNATTRAKVAEGHKASFCLEDSSCDPGGYSRYRCGSGSQGISRNCGDLYGRHLDCQWIDVTDHSSDKAERYIVTQRVNPDQLSSESDYGNNNMECEITIYPGFYLTVHSCKYSDE